MSKIVQGGGFPPPRAGSRASAPAATASPPGPPTARPANHGSPLEAKLALADLALVAGAGHSGLAAFALSIATPSEAVTFGASLVVALVARRELARRHSLAAAIVGVILGAHALLAGLVRTENVVSLSTFARVTSVLVGAALTVTCGRVGLSLYEARPPIPTIVWTPIARTLLIEAVLLVLVGNVPYLLLTGFGARVAMDVAIALVVAAILCRAMLTHAPAVRVAAEAAHAEAERVEAERAAAVSAAEDRTNASPAPPASTTRVSTPPVGAARARALVDDLVLELDDVDDPPPTQAAPIADAAPLVAAEPPRLDASFLQALPPEPVRPILVSPLVAPLEVLEAPRDTSRLRTLGAPAPTPRRAAPSAPAPALDRRLAPLSALPSTPSPRPRGRALDRRVVVGIVAASFALVGLGALVWRFMPSAAAPVVARPAPAAAHSPTPSVAAADELARVAAERAARARLAALEADAAVLPLGGQPLVWWRARLRDSQAAVTGSATTTAMLRARAERLGLTVDRDRLALTEEGAERRRRAARHLTIATGSAAAELEPPAERAARIERRLAARIMRTTPNEGPHLTLSRTPGPRAALRLVFDLPPDAADDAVILDRLALHAVLVANAQARPDLAKRLHALDGDLHITQGATQLAITVELPSSELEAMLALLLEVFCRPKLVPGRFEAARAPTVVALPIGRAGDPASGVEAALLGWQPFSPRDESHVDRMRTIEDVAIRRRVGDTFRVGQLHVAAAGDVDPERIAARIAAYGVAPRRAELRAGLDELAGRHQRLSWVPRVAIAYPIDTDDPTAAATALLATELLDERLFHTLRDAGQAYATYVRLTSIGRRDAILVVMPSASGETELDARNLETQLRQLGAEPVDEAALRRARGAALHALEAALDAPLAAVVDATTPAGRRTHGPGVARALLQVRAPDVSTLLARTLVVERAGTLEFAPPPPRPMPNRRSRR